MTNLEPSIAAASLVTVPALTDGVVSLRKIEARDAKQLMENCLDPEAVRWTTVPLNYSAADAQKFIDEICPQGWVNGSTHTFAIADAVDDRLMGTIDLHSFRAATADVGINLGPAARGGRSRLARGRIAFGLRLQPAQFGLSVLARICAKLGQSQVGLEGWLPVRRTVSRLCRCPWREFGCLDPFAGLG